jgi:hypothetical protein
MNWQGWDWNPDASPHARITSLASFPDPITSHGLLFQSAVGIERKQLGH